MGFVQPCLVQATGFAAQPGWDSLFDALLTRQILPGSVGVT